MNILSLNHVLFEEFGNRDCLPQTRQITVGNTVYSVREFRDGRALLALHIWEMKQEHNKGSTLVVWPNTPLKPRINPNEDFPPTALLSIRVGPATVGIWAYGRGTFMNCRADAELHCRGLQLHLPAALWVGRILARAAELAGSPDCAAAEFWRPDETVPSHS